MQSKYMIHTRPVPHRFKPITKSGVIAWEEGCLKCAVCVKKQCIYGVYEKRSLDPYQMIDSIDNQCMNCFRCVQNCPKELIHKSVNPEFKSIGDSHWSPDIIARLWYQAETGKIPVSGAGYPGPFSGPGFDSMWTDMSEIVRPTRDGIHGREYISTAIDLGRTLKNLSFNEKGDMLSDPPRVVDIPIPIILRIPSFGSLSKKTIMGWSIAARQLGTMLALPWEKIDEELEDFYPFLVPVCTSENMPDRVNDQIRMVDLALGNYSGDTLKRVMELFPSALVSVSFPLQDGVDKKILDVIDSGVPIIHLEGGYYGRTIDDETRFAKDAIRSVHLSLVEAGLRDGITILLGGGLAMAEHVAKSIICGADGVFVDFPVLIALECRMCRRCEQGLSCPVKIEEASPKWVASRTINIIGAWHNQLLEVMGAMGIRDVRRLRGEAGRAMFFEELDKEIFGSLSVMEEGFEFE